MAYVYNSTVNCTDIAIREHAAKYNNSSGGWKSWTTDDGSYTSLPNKAGSSGYYRLTVLRFKTPSNLIEGETLRIKLPVKKPVNVSGTTTASIWTRIYSTDPTGGKLSTITFDETPSLDKISVKANKAIDLYLTLNASSITKANSIYYLAIGSTPILELKNASNWEVTIKYASATSGTAPSVNIIDNKNNTCTISGTLGKNGTNNAMKSAMLYYTTNGKNPDANESWTLRASLGATSAASFSKTVAIPSGCTKIIAIVYCNYTYNESNTGNCSAAVKFRYGPMHSEPVTTWTGQEEGKRLTTKAEVSFVWYDPDWTLAENKANYLPKECLNGYRIRMHEWKKGESSAASIHIGVNSDDSRWYDTWETGETANTLAYGAEYARSGNMNTCTVDPVKLGMVAGDKISIMVHGRYKTAGNPVFVWSNVIGSNAESVANSSPWAMFENEGIVNVKVDGEWKEGQVYVKANNEWKEAESVFTKVDGAWKESQ
jgi:hypothetical protein